MAWQIGIIAVKNTVLSCCVPENFYCSREAIGFEETTAITMSQKFSLAQYGQWTIIIDVDAQFMIDTSYVRRLAEVGEVKLFHVSDQLNYTLIKKNIFGVTRERCIVDSKGAAKAYIEKKNLPWLGDYGETMMLEILEFEVFDNEDFNGRTSLFDLKFDVYEMGRY